MNIIELTDIHKYLKYVSVGKSLLPINQIFIDEFEKGNKTVTPSVSVVDAKPI